MGSDVGQILYALVCEKELSHLPTHPRWSDPYVSSLPEKSFSPTYGSRQAVPWAKRRAEFPYPIQVICLSHPHDLLIPST